MSEPKSHTRLERAQIVKRLEELHREALGEHLVGLATQGSYAREEDREYSDLELVAFVTDIPEGADRLDGEQIFDGMMVDIVWTTEAKYIAATKQVTKDWYIAGSDRLQPVLGHGLIERINLTTPDDLHARCLEQAVKRWPALYEAATKVLNAVERDECRDFGRLLFSALDHVLIELAFINATPFVSTSTFLEAALGLEKRPPSLPELAAIAAEGSYDDRLRVARVVRAVVAELEDLLTAGGAVLDVTELALPAWRPEKKECCPMRWIRHIDRLMSAQSALAMRDLVNLAAAKSQPGELDRIYEWYSTRTTRAIATSYAVATLAAGGLVRYVGGTKDDWWAVGVLIAVIVLAAIVGMFELAELAQLPREFAAASRLLETFRRLDESGAGLGVPLPPARDEHKHGGLRLLAWLVWVIILGGLCTVMYCAAHSTGHSDVEVVVAVLASALAVVMLRRVVAELRPSPDELTRRLWDAQTPPHSLVDRIGSVRLDEYVTDRRTATAVNRCVELALARAFPPQARPPHPESP